jgi:hypothetical protein
MRITRSKELVDFNDSIISGFIEEQVVRVSILDVNGDREKDFN